MRIVVNDIAASSGGALTVLKDFYRCVKENDRENEWIFLLSEKHFDETENIKIRVLSDRKNWLKRLSFDLFSGKKYIQALNPDIVFSLQNTCTFGLKIPQVLYIHQSIPFQSVKKFSFFKKNERKLAIYQYLIGSFIKKSAKLSQNIIVQTEWMKKAVVKKAKVREDKVFKISPNVKTVVVDNTLCFSSSKFFYPTSAVVYKNNSLIYDACRILDDCGLNYSVELTLEQESPHACINCIGQIPYDEVLKKYKQSTLIFPSYIETFGYPLVEARAMGSIILASDCEFSHELLDGYQNAYFFAYDNEYELSTLMKKVINGEILNKSTDEKRETKQPDSWIEVLNVILKNKSGGKANAST